MACRSCIYLPEKSFVSIKWNIGIIIINIVSLLRPSFVSDGRKSRTKEYEELASLQISFVLHSIQSIPLKV